MTVMTIIVAVIIFLLATLLAFVAGYKSGYIGCIEKFRETLETFKKAVDLAEEMKKKEGMANAEKMFMDKGLSDLRKKFQKEKEQLRAQFVAERSAEYALEKEAADV